MIIVSQENNKAVDLNKLLSIYIHNNSIQAEYPWEEGWTCLGKYKTRERTEEVFKEIIERHSNWENMKAGQPEGICMPVYEMPLE